MLFGFCVLSAGFFLDMGACTAGEELIFSITVFFNCCTKNTNLSRGHEVR